MSSTRLLASALSLSGLLCLLTSLETASLAVDCGEPVEHSPYTCERAHEDPGIPPSTNLSCERDSKNRCVPGQGSSCGSDLGFGIAVKGKCVIQPAGSNPYACYTNYGITVVEIHCWTSNCIEENGECTCETYADPNTDPKDVQICDCYEVVI